MSDGTSLYAQRYQNRHRVHAALEHWAHGAFKRDGASEAIPRAALTIASAAQPMFLSAASRGGTGAHMLPRHRRSA